MGRRTMTRARVMIARALMDDANIARGARHRYWTKVPRTSSEIEAQPAIEQGEVTRVVPNQAVGGAEGELQVLARALDELRVERHEPLVADVVVGNRILVPDTQRPCISQRLAD